MFMLEWPEQERTPDNDGRLEHRASVPAVGSGRVSGDPAAAEPPARACRPLVDTQPLFVLHGER